jgi:hypothetical protein
MRPTQRDRTPCRTGDCPDGHCINDKFQANSLNLLGVAWSVSYSVELEPVL